jgi:hypothetical protein
VEDIEIDPPKDREVLMQLAGGVEGLMGYGTAQISADNMTGMAWNEAISG